jgi:predicted MFS family arabinose efflux permease
MSLRLPAVLREQPSFRLLFAGQALSVIGDRITPVALAFAVLELGSATDLGIIFAAGALPFALFAVAGGVVADRVGRREVMLVSDVVRAIVQAFTASILLTGTAEVWMLIVLSALYGMGSALFSPALNGLIPQTVGPRDLQAANALLALTRSAANVVGPAVAGVIVALVGSGEAIALDAATFVVSALCLVRMRVRPVPAGAAGEGHDGFLAQLRAGWHEVRSRTWLRRGLVAMSAYHVFVLPSVFVLGPVLADRQLDGASSWAIIVAAFGLGTIVGNAAALRFPVRRPILMAAAALVVASLQAAIIGSGLGTWGIAGLEVIAGVGVALFFTLWDLSLQEQVAPQAVARVSSYDFAVSVGLMPLGLAVAAPIADAVGLQETLWGMSALGVASALLWLAAPSVRRLERPQAARLDPADLPEEVPVVPQAAAAAASTAAVSSGSSGRAR